MCNFYHERMHTDDPHWNPFSQKMCRPHLQKRTEWLSSSDSFQILPRVISRRLPSRLIGAEHNFRFLLTNFL
mgnify:CR=1 FL=1